MLVGGPVLIVEDEVIVAFALEDMLLEMGAEVLMATTIEQGFAGLANAQFAFAVLDVNVNGEKSYALADELTERSIPVIFATGYGYAEHPPRFASAPTLTKPYTSQQLAQAVEALL